MAKPITMLADTCRQVQAAALRETSDRELCELIRAHFESHPTLPGEKKLKDSASYELAQLTANEAENEDASIDPEVREGLIQGYAGTRIRESSVTRLPQFFAFNKEDMDTICQTPMEGVPQEHGAPIQVTQIDVTLRKLMAVGDDPSEIGIYAVRSDNTGDRFLGTVPRDFLQNNPMNVDSCDAQLQVADYSNGKMKNLSVKLVVDTDLMSGDVVSLDESVFNDMNQETGLEQ